MHPIHLLIYLNEFLVILFFYEKFNCTEVKKGGRVMVNKQNPSDGKYDVAIIGSGPSGSAAAKALSGYGLKNILIEKANLPRYKMCSGVLSPSSVKFVTEHFGALPDHVMSKPVEVIGARIHTGLDRHFVDIRFSAVDQGPGYPELGMSVKRTEFDHWMATSADAAIVDNCRFNGIAGTDPAISIEVEHNGAHRLITAKYLIGADGVLSRVRNAISPEFDKTIRIIPNYEEWYTGEIDLEPKWLNVFIDEKLTRFRVGHAQGRENNCRKRRQATLRGQGILSIPHRPSEAQFWFCH